MKLAALLGSGLVLVVLGCSVDAGGSRPDFRIDTIGSIPVTTNLATEPLPAPDDVVPQEIFRIGSISGAQEGLFSGPLISVSNGPNGQLFVVDQLDLVVRVFGRDGTFLREFSRAGHGPGELGYPSALVWDRSGRLWIPEPFEMRYSVFDSIGRFVKTVPRSLFRGLNRRVFPSVFASEATIVDHASFGEGAGMFLADTTGLVLDSFPPMMYPPRPESNAVLVGRDEEWLAAVQSFRPKLVWTLAQDGTLWMARSDSLRLIHRSLDGDTLRIIETRHRPPSFTPKEEETVARVSQMYEDVELTPAVVQSLHASAGLLFVQIVGELGQPGREVDVFDAEGEYLGTFELELPIQPLSQSHFIDGYFTYVGVGSLDVPVVVQTRIER